MIYILALFGVLFFIINIHLCNYIEKLEKKALMLDLLIGENKKLEKMWYENLNSLNNIANKVKEIKGV